MRKLSSAIEPGSAFPDLSPEDERKLVALIEAMADAQIEDDIRDWREGRLKRNRGEGAHHNVCARL